MSTIFRLTLICLLLISLCNCSDPKATNLSRALAHGIADTGFETLLDKQYLLIVPRIGCMGCISSTENYMLNVYVKQREKLNILLTDINSYKTARVRFGTEFLEASNVFVDRQGAFKGDDLSGIYPMIVRLDDGKISQITLVSPENEFAIENLRTEINE